MVEEQINQRAVLNQPAGHVEHGELFTEAVIRETHEETGCWLRPDALIGLYLWQVPNNDTQIMRLCFSGQVDHIDNTPILDTDITATHWLNAKELAARSEQLRSPLVMRTINDYQAGYRYPLEMATILTDTGDIR